MWAGAAKIGMAQHKTAVRSRGLIKMEEKIALGGGSWGRRGWKRGDEEEKEGGFLFSPRVMGEGEGSTAARTVVG